MALAERCGLHLAQACERVSLAESGCEVAYLLSVEPGKALLRLDRVICARHDLAVEWRIGLCKLGNTFTLRKCGSEVRCIVRCLCAPLPPVFVLHILSRSVGLYVIGRSLHYHLREIHLSRSANAKLARCQ